MKLNIINRLKAWLDRDDRPFMIYVKWQFDSSHKTVNSEPAFCPTCFQVRLFAVPLAIGFALGFFSCFISKI